jgi:cysteinyl-tRNA synthetase
VDHNGMVQVSGEKMSKSLGNFTTLSDVLERYDARALRLLILQTTIARPWRSTQRARPERGGNRPARCDGAPCCRRPESTYRRRSSSTSWSMPFRDAMDDDLGTPSCGRGHLRRAASSQRGIGRQRPRRGAALSATVAELAGALGLTLDRGGPDGADSDEISALVAARQAARAGRDFAEADRLRDVLTARGIVVEDTAAGPVWRRA